MNWRKTFLYVVSAIFLALGVGFYMLNHELAFELLMNGHNFNLQVSNSLVCGILALVLFVMGYKANN